MSRKEKKVIQKEKATPQKKPIVVETPEDFYDKVPSWSFKMMDNGYVKWGLCHANDLYNKVIKKLVDFEGMTWGEIIKATGGRNHRNNNHYENVSDLTLEAQKRWKDLKLEEYDRVFSLRLSGKERLYGILLSGIFRIIWYDSEHEIYPIDK